MAQIKTVDGVMSDVKESKEQIDIIMRTNTDIIDLNLRVSFYRVEPDGDLEDKYEPVSFIKQNIIMYY